MLPVGMRLSLQVQYAICGAFDLAYNGRGQPIQVGVISARQTIPPRYLEQIFQRLRRAQLVVSKRGPGGGYSLARPPAEISLREIVEAIGGPLVEGLDAIPTDSAGAAYRPDFLWRHLADRLAQTLEETSLAGLCRDAAQAQVARADLEGPMYFI